MLRTLIAEDHALARQRLRDLLATIPWVELVAEVTDGDAALGAIDRLRPDLVLLDIEMPGLSGLEVIERMSHDPHVIFTTAHSQHAVAAFELQALDYLLKPFGRRRLVQALERARQALEDPDQPDPEGRAETVFEPGRPLDRLFVHRRGKIIPLATREVERLEAAGDYVEVRTAGDRFLVRATLEAVAAKLDPRRFARVHRSHVVNLDHVLSMEPFDGSRLQLELRSGATVVASRSRSADLRRRLG